MKRKLLLIALMISLLVCIFAISAGAAGSGDNGYGAVTPVDGVSAPSVIDTTSRVVLLAADGTYYTFPSYYILQDSATFGWKQNAEVSAILGYTPKDNTSDFRPYVVRIEIPEGVTATNPNSNGGGTVFEDAKKLLEVTLPSSLTVMGNYTFNRANSLATINGFEDFIARATKLGTLMLANTAWGEGVDLVIPEQIESVPQECFYGTKINSVTFPSTLTALGARAFQGCTNLTSVTLPASLENMKNHIFASCSGLESIDMSKCTKLKEIGEYCFEKTKITSFDFTPFASTLVTVGNGLFNECYQLSSVTGYENVTGISAIGANMFNGCPLPEIKLPPNVTSIGNKAFFGHKSTQTEFRIPNGVASIGDHAFTRASAGGGEGLKIYLSASLTTVSNDYTFENWYYSEMYIPSTLTAIPKGFCNKTLQTGVVYYYTGASNGFTIDSTHNDAMLNAEWISFSEFNESSSAKNYIVYGCNTCNVFYNGEHKADTNPCFIVCDRCQMNAQDPNAQHVFNSGVIAYNYGYASNGTFTKTCQTSGCVYSTTPVVEITAPLFELLGYSTDSEGTRLVAGYKVNEEAYNEYVAQDGVSLSYGVVAYVPNEGETSCNPLEAQNGAVSLVDKQYTIHSEINECYMFDFIITGFDAAQSVTLAMCAYAYDGEKVVYLCSEGGALVQYDSAQAVTVYNGTVVNA